MKLSFYQLYIKSNPSFFHISQCELCLNIILQLATKITIILKNLETNWSFIVPRENENCEGNTTILSSVMDLFQDSASILMEIQPPSWVGNSIITLLWSRPRLISCLNAMNMLWGTSCKRICNQVGRRWNVVTTMDNSFSARGILASTWYHIIQGWFTFRYLHVLQNYNTPKSSQLSLFTLRPNYLKRARKLSRSPKMPY